MLGESCLWKNFLKLLCPSRNLRESGSCGKVSYYKVWPYSNFQFPFQHLEIHPRKTNIPHLGTTSIFGGTHDFKISGEKFPGCRNLEKQTNLFCRQNLNHVFHQPLDLYLSHPASAPPGFSGRNHELTKPWFTTVASWMGSIQHQPKKLRGWIFRPYSLLMEEKKFLQSPVEGLR